VLVSIIIPLYNEAEGLAGLMERLLPAAQLTSADYERIFVNDGSTDERAQILAGMSAGNTCLKLLGFGRDFGHQTAIPAGLDFANGDAVVPASTKNPSTGPSTWFPTYGIHRYRSQFRSPFWC